MLFSQVVVNLLLELGDGVDPVADHQCFEPSLVRGEHNKLDKQSGTFVQFKCKGASSHSLHFLKIVLAPCRGQIIASKNRFDEFIAIAKPDLKRLAR